MLRRLKNVSKRKSYLDIFTGESDENIHNILNSDNDNSRLKKLLLNVINNELTPRQKEIIMLYYFKNTNIVTIAKKLEITPQAVSAVISRAKVRMYKILKYYL